MKGFIVGTAATAVTFAIVAYFLPQIDYGDSIPNLIVVAIVAGLVNGLIKPVVKVMSLPVTMMTLGLFSFVINAAMLLLIAWIASFIGSVTFTVGGFPPSIDLDALSAALIGGIAISIVGSLVGRLVRD